MFGRFHGIAANGQRAWDSLGACGRTSLGALGLMDEPLEFAARPSNDIEIDPFESGTQLRPVEVAKVNDPAANDGIIDLIEILQGFVAKEMKPPASDDPDPDRARAIAPQTSMERSCRP